MNEDLNHRQAVRPLDMHAERLRAELDALRKQLSLAQGSFDEGQAKKLVEAGEQLIAVALQVDAVAETAARDLASLVQSSQRDVLTDTPNRALMLDRLDSAIARARRQKKMAAVLFIDLDHFKHINDTFGHAAGDDVLKAVAQVLEAAVRDSDTVSRHGGDEFVVLLDEVARASDAGRIARKILESLAASERLSVSGLRVSASIGIALYPDAGADAPTLISHADAAMYRAKRRGRANFDFYAPEQDGDASPPVPAGAPARTSGPVTMTPPSAGAGRLAPGKPEPAAPPALPRKRGPQAGFQETHDRHIGFLEILAPALRAPLEPMRAATDRLESAGTDPVLLAELHSTIRSQIAQLSRLVDDLHDGSHVTTGTFRLYPERLDIVEVLGQAAAACRPAIEARLQRLTLALPDVPVMVHGDPLRLMQVFRHLLENACKFTQRRGEINLTAIAGGSRIEITVSDNGNGISAEDLPDIFDLFVKSTPETALGTSGLGIGLAVVRALVQTHGGSVTGSSAGNDLGSQFTVILPTMESVAA